MNNSIRGERVKLLFIQVLLFSAGTRTGRIHFPRLFIQTQIHIFSRLLHGKWMVFKLVYVPMNFQMHRDLYYKPKA